MAELGILVNVLDVLIEQLKAILSEYDPHLQHLKLPTRR